MKTLTHSITRTLAAVLLAVVAAAPLFAADAVKFRPATAADPVVGRYLVTIATADAATDATTADVLARSYGGRIEPYAVEGFRGFMIVMAPSRARALSADPRVAVVEEQAGREEDAVFAVPEPPRPAVTASPAQRVEAVRQPRTDWVQGNALWESGDITYDGAGNVKSIGIDLYRYDGTGRLTYATAKTAPSPANAQQFEYDRYGNLKRVTTTTTAGTEVTRYALDAAANNRLTTTCPAGETYNDCVTGIYDDAGNQTGITTAGEFVWDPLGMMKERHGVGVQRYLYDANDERIATLHYVAGLEARRTHTLRGLDNKVTREVSYDSATAEWKLIRDYVYRSGTLIAAFGSTGNTPAVHYHVDHLGSTRLVTDGAGYQSAFHTYWPFGEEAPGSDLDAERLKFTSHERDSFGDGSLDLDYMHARFYNPGAGRFLSIDPGKDWDPKLPQSWNLYVYVRNNPINAIDLTGKISYLVTRGSVSKGQHMFVVTNARYPGDPRATVYSYGKTNKGNVGLVDHSTRGFSEGTRANDQKIWIGLRFGDVPLPERLAYTAIPASDAKVDAAAQAMQTSAEYHPIAGPNSNSAALAVAEVAAGKDVLIPEVEIPFWEVAVHTGTSEEDVEQMKEAIKDHLLEEEREP